MWVVNMSAERRYGAKVVLSHERVVDLELPMSSDVDPSTPMTSRRPELSRRGG